MIKIRHLAGELAWFCVMIVVLIPVSTALSVSHDSDDLIMGHQWTCQLDTTYQSDEGYILDQMQDQTNNLRYTTDGWYLVQSFKPGLSPLGKVELLLEINIDDSSQLILELALRDNRSIQGEPIDQTQLTLHDINEEKIWVEWVFANPEVIINDTYYLTFQTIGDGDCYWYGYYDQDQYSSGHAYGYNISSEIWQNLSNLPVFRMFDFCFKTYTVGNNSAPYDIHVSGPSRGKPGTSYVYTLSAEDAEDDLIYYHIVWGDETNNEWIGPVEPGASTTVSHTWDQTGRYQILARAKDINGQISEWSEPLPVIMPKHSIFFYIIQRWVSIQDVFTDSKPWT